MTKLSWPSGSQMRYDSTREVESCALPGVLFRIRKMSFGRRLEFARRVREFSHRLEFLQAGESAVDKLESAAITAEIDQMYLDWGLVSVRGLWIDGGEADARSVGAAGPEDFCREVIAAIKRECFLYEEDRKN